jgi:hypothetical protein
MTKSDTYRLARNFGTESNRSFAVLKTIGGAYQAGTHRHGIFPGDRGKEKNAEIIRISLAGSFALKRDFNGVRAVAPLSQRQERTRP